MAEEAGVVSPEEAIRVKALEDAKAKVQHTVDSFGASPVFGFTTWKFWIGVAISYFAIYMFGCNPADFWKWHVCQFWILFPIHVYRNWKRNLLLMFSELCWIMSLLLCTLLPAWYFYPQLFPEEFFNHLRLACFAISVGPLGLSVALCGNPLVPHSIDHTMDLLIHLTPVLTGYCLVWYPHGLRHGDEIPPITAVPRENFWNFFQPGMLCMLGYYCFHAAFHLSCGLYLATPDKKGPKEEPLWGYREGCYSAPRTALTKGTFYTYIGHDALFKPPGKNDDGDDHGVKWRFLIYDAIMCTATLLMMASSYCLYYFGTQQAHFGYCCVIFSLAIWNGATWYDYNLKKFTRGVDDLINASKKEGKQEEKKVASYGSVGTEVK